MKTAKKKRIRRKKKKFTFERFVKTLFVFAAAFFIGTKFFVYSYNITLSNQDQTLTKKMNKEQEQVDQLTSEVNILQEKSRVLGLLDEKVTDNQKNIYVIDD
ncbi:hypothetical protein [Catenisphaera adipataccumulans]|jgi:cell division protein FtsL|uniref:Cell division protein FtsL n=1 Tax=Catenisphaera adipataccumulans TaxID=700500 RepID=A0A7W8CYV9_9FIRM|nr:hypothetical protein [Catenisphaera adipataccumulans]MBB5182914.1 cell division protein FtsL [Catenisphaera adipataccumulans]